MKTTSLFFLLFLVFFCCRQQRACAQLASCGATVPFFSVDLTGSPSGVWTSPNHKRKGSCCLSADVCTSFRVIIDTGAALIKFDIIAGSIPSGAMYYQVDCGPLVPVGSYMVVTGPGPINITFCKPGNNANVYQIGTIPKSSMIITGSGSVAICGTTTLSSPVTGGTWSTSNAAVATVNSSTGVVTGVTVGTAIISYMLGTALVDTTTVTVTPVPPITGVLSVCVGGTTALADAAGPGDCSSGVCAWSSSNISKATVSSTGVVTGVATGTATITFSLGSGCTATAVVTVNQAVPAITGAGTVCAGSTITLADATAGGGWSSSNIGIATINSSTGVATGITAGTTNITYTIAGGCRNTTVITVMALPAAISGVATLCVGSAATLTDATSGGTWSSGTVAIAAIGSGSGIVSGVSAGTTSITYTTAAGCKATKPITVNAAPVISGTETVCVGSTTALNSNIAGGTWSSGNSSVASIGSSSGMATGVAAGTATITYQLATGCKDADVVTVNPLPAAIAGAGTICAGSTTALTDATPGGTWSSGNASVAAIGVASGVVSGISAGTASVTYTTAAGCNAAKQMTVNPSPVISGATTVCIGLTTALNGNIASGTWSSSNAGIASVGSSTGVASGVTTGAVYITYQLANGCKDTASLVVNPVPAAISGPLSVCVAGTVTLSDATAGGTWQSANPGKAAVDPVSGIVTGVAVGNTHITYALATGCVSVVQVTINALPVITNVAPRVCLGGTATLTGTPAGGTWSSNNTGVASIGSSSGVVTGVIAGTAIITYQLATGCNDTAVLVIDPPPAAISGPASTCVSGSIGLSDASAGGTWSSGNAGIATVGVTSGIVSGVAVGNATITYTSPGGCQVTRAVTVMPQPTIDGAAQICAGQTLTLSCSMTGGTWSSADATLASVNSATGEALGISAGNPVISYITSWGCQAGTTITVNATPAAISGPSGLCIGGITTFSNTVAGGHWVCGDTTVGCINWTTGLFNGVSTGATTIIYATGAGCTAAKNVSVNATTSLTGKDQMCIGFTTSLSCSLGGGTWTSSYTDTATVTSAGVVFGVRAGTATITYTAPGGCQAMRQVRVNDYVYPLETSPLSTPLRTNICLTNNLQLNSPLGGDGIWRSSDTTKATVTNLVPGSSVPWGLVHAVALGTVTISYTASNGCTSTHTITINAMPVITSAPPTICRYQTTTLNATPAGGQWISQTLTVAQVGSYNGVVHTSTPGTSNIFYRLFTYDACAASVTATVNSCTKDGGGVAGADEAAYNVFPNPGSGRFIIRQSVPVDGSMRLIVVNYLGQSVYDGNVAFVGGQGTLDMANMAPGCYAVKLEAEHGEKNILRIAVE